MRWMRFRIRTTTAAEDILVSSMEDVGLYGAQIEDHVPLTAAEKEQMFVDILPEGPADDGRAVLSFYLQEDEDGNPVIEHGQADNSAAYSGGSLQSVQAGPEQEHVTPQEMKRRIEDKIKELRQYCDDLGEGTVLVEETQDTDWANSWKQYFHQFWIDDILVLPSWEEPAVREIKPALVFHIDPGTAFGTGAHETTQLCIRAIRKQLTDRTRILDVGTGSGILAILALMLGAQSAVGTDLDPCAEPAIRENIAVNKVPAEKFHFILGNLVNDPKVQKEVGEQCYDIVAANILPDVLVPLTPAAVKALKPGGYYITSGIVDGREHEVSDAMVKAGLTDITVTSQGEWHCVTGRKPVTEI